MNAEWRDVNGNRDGKQPPLRSLVRVQSAQWNTADPWTGVANPLTRSDFAGPGAKKKTLPEGNAAEKNLN